MNILKTNNIDKWIFVIVKSKKGEAFYDIFTGYLPSSVPWAELDEEVRSAYICAANGKKNSDKKPSPKPDAVDGKKKSKRGKKGPSD